MSDILYFGCWRDKGHHLFERDGRGILPNRHPAWMGELRVERLDTLMAPRGEHSNALGHARLTHLDGVTVLSFWDRSVDTRYDSHSTFVAEGKLSFEEVVAASRLVFPHVWERMKFEVKLVENV